MSGNRLYRQVVEKISDLIESGEYPEGSRLPPERELAERFNVSRPTVREAVIALEAIGHIAVKTGSGMYVTGKSGSIGGLGDISPFELMEARVMIEGEAAALAASLITAEQIEALEAALQKMAQENTIDGLGPDCADREFHAVIAEATNNRVMRSMIQELWDTQERLEHVRTAHNAICEPDPEIRLREHRTILNALAKHDANGARVAMRKHFERTIEALHTAVEAQAVAEVRLRLSQSRERFSSDRIIDSAGGSISLPD